MKKCNISLLKVLLLFIVAAGFFIYGLSVHRYQVFPYSILKKIVETDEQILMRSENFKYTALQRLYINKMYVPYDKSNGGAMVASGRDVFIIDRQGAMIAYDFNTFDRMVTDVPDIPMGLDMLEEAGWNNREDFNPTKMRVKGAYADRKGDESIDLYVFHHFFNGECFESKLSRINLAKNFNRISSGGEWEVLFTTTPCLYPDSDLLEIGDMSVKRWIFAGHISGGRIIRYDESHILVSVGDYFYDGYDKEIYAMDDEISFGKFILINIENGEHQIFAKGSRNAQGLYMDREGIIWATEHGPQGGDELNIIKEGENYGWPMETLGIHYNNTLWPVSGDQGRHDQFMQPVFAWPEAIAPSDLIRIENEKFGIWKGDLLVSSLSGMAIHRLRPDIENSRILYDEKIDIGHRIRNIITLHDGSILLRTDDNYLIHIDDAGAVYEEFDEDTFFSENEIARRFKEINGTIHLDTSINQGALVFERSCTNCHAVGGSSLIGPNLAGLANREVGSLADFNYSEALKSSDRVWNERLLREYLKSPEATFPGTSMGRVNLSDREIEDINEYLFNVSSR